MEKINLFFRFKDVIYIGSYKDNIENKFLANSQYLILPVGLDKQFRIPLKYCFYKQDGYLEYSLLSDKEYELWNPESEKIEKLTGIQIWEVYNKMEK